MRLCEQAAEHFVANVARNLCNQKFSASSFALGGHFEAVEEVELWLHPLVGDNGAQ